MIDALLEEVGWEEKKEQPDLLLEEVRHARLAPQEWEDQKPAANTVALWPDASGVWPPTFAD